MSDAPRVWIGSLSAYNDGHLLGDWFDAIDCPTTGKEWVEAMVERKLLRAGNVGLVPLAQIHEEIWVFDHDNFLGLLKGECSPAEAQRLAGLLDSVPDDQREAFASFVGDGRDPGDFEDAYSGTWNSWTDYVYNFVDDSGYFEGVSDRISCYFDYDKFGRDLRMDFDVYDLADGSVAVFRQ